MRRIVLTQSSRPEGVETVGDYEEYLNRLDSGMKPGERGMPLTMGEAKLAAKKCRDEYDRMVMKFMFNRICRLQAIIDERRGNE